jgi:23S rRNA pseudouridine1911/1915/1917 synthase
MTPYARQLVIPRFASLGSHAKLKNSAAVLGAPRGTLHNAKLACPASSIGDSTSGIKHRESSIQHRMSSPLDILYDDGPVLVINKPAGVLTQAPAGIDSLEVQVKAFYREREGKPADASIYLGLPHRLDRPVSGAIVFARHERAAQRISTQFENRTVSKSYWAFVEGLVAPDEGTWTDYLHKRHGMAQAEVVAADHPAAKHAVLHYRVRWRSEAGSWLEIELETGRTHQIRIQASSRGHAVVGDSQYGSTTPFGDPALDLRDRPIALHARQLVFRHPMTPEQVSITAPLPPTWDALNLPKELVV